MAKCILPRKIRGDLQTEKQLFSETCVASCKKIRFHEGKSLRNLRLCPGIVIGISFANDFLKEVT
jgi:hypothetical protein